MTVRSAAIYHDGTYLRNHPTWHEEDAQYKARDILALLSRHSLRPLTICEVGCGSGAILEALSRQLDAAATFTGYDISEQALALCRARERDKLRFLQGSLPDESVRFDLVLAIDVIEHVEDYLGFLKALRTRGVYKIFRIPLNLSVQSVLFESRPILDARKSFGHLHYFTKETALAALGDTGYQIVDWFHTFSPVPAATVAPVRAILKSLKTACFRVHREWVARLLDGFSVVVLCT